MYFPEFAFHRSHKVKAWLYVKWSNMFQHMQHTMSWIVHTTTGRVILCNTKIPKAACQNVFCGSWYEILEGATTGLSNAGSFKSF
jgi:hypothetical protein